MKRDLEERSPEPPTKKIDLAPPPSARNIYPLVNIEIDNALCPLNCFHDLLKIGVPKLIDYAGNNKAAVFQRIKEILGNVSLTPFFNKEALAPLKVAVGYGNGEEPLFRFADPRDFHEEVKAAFPFLTQTAQAGLLPSPTVRMLLNSELSLGAYRTQLEIHEENHTILMPIATSHPASSSPSPSPSPSP